MGASGGSSGLPTNLQPQYERNNGFKYYGLPKKESNTKYIEELPGNVKDARKMFKGITKGATLIKDEKYRYGQITRMKFPNNDIVTLRTDSKSGGAVIEVNRTRRNSGAAQHNEKIHFKSKGNRK
jgi:hypothetical protein